MDGYNGSNTHSSDPATGTRVSLVAFYHQAATLLSSSELEQLEMLEVSERVEVVQPQLVGHWR